jgi:hypothetical protein
MLPSNVKTVWDEKLGAAFRRPIDPGLCGTCTHTQVIESSKGSRFRLCRLAATDTRFPKYPPLPVVRCSGYQRADDPASLAKR